jgi:DegV family protein with EDD domain
MSEIMVVTDSVAQIPPEMAQHYNIGVIPFSIIIGDQSYKDGIDILPTDLYQRMRTEDILPSTSQPSVGEYIHFFKNCLDQGAKSILYFSVSEKLSGAFSTATKAAHLLEEEYPEKEIRVFDSGTATIAQGYLAIKTARAASEGQKMDRLVELAQATRPRVGFIAMFETLYYLERGGRIGKAAYLAGSLINIKPLITIDREGLVAPLGNIRGDKNVLKRLVDCMAKEIGERAPIQVAVMHADEVEKAEQLKQITQERFNVSVYLTCEFTPVMGAHAGPGVLGLGYQLA